MLLLYFGIEHKNPHNPSLQPIATAPAELIVKQTFQTQILKIFYSQHLRTCRWI